MVCLASLRIQPMSLAHSPASPSSKDKANFTDANCSRIDVRPCVHCMTGQGLVMEWMPARVYSLRNRNNTTSENSFHPKSWSTTKFYSDPKSLYCGVVQAELAGLVRGINGSIVQLLYETPAPLQPALKRDREVHRETFVRNCA